MSAQLLAGLIIVPILGFAGCIILPKKRESAIFYTVMAAMSLELALFLMLSFNLLGSGGVPVSTNLGDLYLSHHYKFSLEFYFERLSATFMGMAILMTTLVFAFSKYYMHREPGFKRFYYTVMLFLIGLSLIVLAGNFEVLLLGWEFIGISSVLLIAFYRDRFLPARNALKIFSVYRIADAFLLMAIWYAHHIFEKSIRFADLSQVTMQYGDQMVVLGLLLFAAALIKSAQFPFSYWLPRAMEGPTTSSAIFYGALSVHMGLFLMLRTHPLWDGSIELRILIAVFGIMTALVASSIARVQSSIKTQIAYASVTQIGIMFIEVAAGLYWLALIHFVCNACLRMYQLLISPSAVSYLVHDQFFYFVPPAQRIKNTPLGRLRATLYVVGIKEWNMNTAASHYIWNPLKSVGRIFAFLDTLLAQAVALMLFLAVVGTITAKAFPDGSLAVVSIIAAAVSVILYVRAYATKNSAIIAWNLIMLGHLYGALFLYLASSGNWRYLVMYGASVVIAFVAGYLCLRYLRARGESIMLREYNGSIFAFKVLGHVFFIICLLFMVFPVGPSFLARDALLSLIPEGHVAQLVLFCVAYVLAGVSIMRLYTKVFFGPYASGYHEKAYKSS